MDAVHRFEGTVNQVLGDGIMALFGALLAHEDHACAPHAAWPCMAAMRSSLKRSAVLMAWRCSTCGPQLRRSGGARHLERPAHGLLCRRETTHLQRVW